MSQFQPKLLAMFVAIEPEFRKRQIEAYRERAERELEAWLKLLDGPEPQTNHEWRSVRLPEYVTVAGGSYGYHWPSLQDRRKKGDFRADFQRAERDANASVDHAKAHFVTKQTKKLDNATKNHAKIEGKVSGQLRFEAGIITGALRVEYVNGDEFTMTMSLIVNYRYNGRWGRTTSFYQFPSRFTAVKLRGEPVKAKGRMSEGWMEENFK